jgi:hypothetical protein
MSYATSNNAKFYDKIRQQYEYAKENVDSIKRSAGMGVSSANMTESLQNEFLAKCIEFVKKILYLAAAFFVFTLIVKNVSFNHMILESKLFKLRYYTISLNSISIV